MHSEDIKLLYSGLIRRNAACFELKSPQIALFCTISQLESGRVRFAAKIVFQMRLQHSSKWQTSRLKTWDDLKSPDSSGYWAGSFWMGRAKASCSRRDPQRTHLFPFSMSTINSSRGMPSEDSSSMISFGNAWDSSHSLQINSSRICHSTTGRRA